MDIRLFLTKKNITLPSEECTNPLTAKYMSISQVVDCSLPASVAVICLFDLLTVKKNGLWVVISHTSDNVFSETCLSTHYHISYSGPKCMCHSSQLLYPSPRIKGLARLQLKNWGYIHLTWTLNTLKFKMTLQNYSTVKLPHSYTDAHFMVHLCSSHYFPEQVTLPFFPSI
jgi:hypothetical protein